MITIFIPNNNLSERSYIIQTLLTDFLGLEICIKEGNNADYLINLPNKKTLLIKDDFFSKFPVSLSYLAQKNIPQNIDCISDQFTAVYNLPIIFGSTDLNVTAESILCGVDIFASSFFMLSRWEEYTNSEKDTHERFSAKSSLAYKHHFLDRPIVNEYLEMLWNMLYHLCPDLARLPRKFRTLVSCDLDNPYMSITRIFRRLLSNIIKGSPLPTNIKNMIANCYYIKMGRIEHDVYYQATNWIMDENDKLDQKVAFYFITKHPHSKDGSIKFSDPFVKRTMQLIAKRGHEIGLHGSYSSFNKQNQIAAEMDTLQQQMNELGIKQEKIGCRQHYLRWESPLSARYLADAELDYDTTLSFADLPGFRCGVCYEFNMFDFLGRQTLALKQRPLILMECSVISARYLGLGYSEESLEYMLSLKMQCVKYQGDFTVLWHNSELVYPEAKALYLSVIK